MIKYIGSKRRLVPRIVGLAQAIPGAQRALDLFTGTTRVAQGLKRAGFHVTANDLASYSAVLASTYVATDAAAVDHAALRAMLAELEALPGVRGYFTRTFCEEARYLQPHNGMRVDAIRARIETITSDATLRAILLTALLEAADRVDSTTGLQMAYLKEWSPRSARPLSLREPQLIPGKGRVLCGDAREMAKAAGPVDVAYVDPPYNQHSYYRNYHVWETLVRGDAPETYGVARKRADCRSTRSDFNSRPRAARALEDTLDALEATHVILSFSDEGFLDVETLRRMLLDRWGEVAGIPVPSKRYVGAQIGIHDLRGQPVGIVGHLTNTEWLFVAGRDAVAIAESASQPTAEVA